MIDGPGTEHESIIGNIRINGFPNDLNVFGFPINDPDEQDGDYTFPEFSSEAYDFTDPADTALLNSLLGYRPNPAASGSSNDVDHSSSSGRPALVQFDQLPQAVAGAARTDDPQAPEAVEPKTTLHVQLKSPPSEEPFFQHSFPEQPSENTLRLSPRQPGSYDNHENINTTSPDLRNSQTDDERAREYELWGTDDEAGADEASDSNTDHRCPPSHKSTSTTPDIQAATVLFKNPTPTSKKYTRPVMSKMFLSLELSPEVFVRIQAAAKTFMLDENHPERFDCIADRGDKGKIDLTKIKLFSSAEQFLETEGWGERCYGVSAVGGGRTLKWPQMKQKIISLIVPLLRRMVANEKQRRYAVSTRSGRKRLTKRPREEDSISASSVPGSPQRAIQPAKECSVERPADPKVKIPRYIRAVAGDEASAARKGVSREPVYVPAVGTSGAKYQINVVEKDQRIMPSFTLTPATCPSFSSLVQYISSILEGGSQNLLSVHILSPRGLVGCLDEESWRLAVESVLECQWLDGEVKCVCEVKDILRSC